MAVLGKLVSAPNTAYRMKAAKAYNRVSLRIVAMLADEGICSRP